MDHDELAATKLKLDEEIKKSSRKDYLLFRSYLADFRNKPQARNAFINQLIHDIDQCR